MFIKVREKDRGGGGGKGGEGKGEGEEKDQYSGFFKKGNSYFWPRWRHR